MKRVILIALLVVAIIGVGIGVSLYIKHQELNLTTLPQGTTIYDVRTQDEFTIRHIASATLFPLTDLQAGKLPDVAKDSPIAVYCTSGNRSKQAADILKKAGFTNIIDIGSIQNVDKYGLSVVQ